ncbi:FHA domain-containing protein [Erwinia psidii]|uniref:FHA domain-containing protein n=1 Tax=Erwinia psidii TaxID=69224 RepID=A0A3N6SM10_9GAMM|nr:FHA domain-containing protein [Erwinia psidii]MCX8956566.1 FHA domain-containing protein [Erwinia psidii]MCX8961524.1 FHA domain-containing protein [Erwinia psidii]MCX8965008.1 FHA domain-containing protein [Erwinia psidii]RQM39901.1 FHA domain-containing protein [Erwinia psidii]
MPYELRVLTGLHRGALLPLSGTQWLIGSSSDADLTLYDPVIKENHCRINHTTTNWQVEGLQGPVLTEEGYRTDRIEDLTVGTPFSLDGIWLCIEEANSPWDEKENITQKKEENPVSAQNKENERRRRSPFPALICFFLALTAMVLAIFSSEEKVPPATQQADCIQPASRIYLESTQQVSNVLQQMFEEADLFSQLSIEIKDKGNITVSLDNENKLLESTHEVLSHFEKLYDSDVQIILNIIDTFPSLPFKVIQVVKGQSPYLVTEDGQYIFINDRLCGINFVAITDDKLIFEGKQKIEVSW